MAREIWGAYSVNDHLGPHAFLADLMFYDRLVLPVPLPNEEAEWDHRKWNPKRQAAFAEVLEKADRVKKVPWPVGTWERARAAGEAQKDAFVYTRTRLTENLPSRVRGVTVVPSYAKPDEYIEESGLRLTQQDTVLHSGHAVAAMTLKFLVADFDRPMEPDYLDRVLEVTCTPEHAKARAAFWHWLRDFFGDDVLTDRESIEAALDEMNDLFADLQRVTRWKAVKTRGSYLFLAGAVALPFIAGPLATVVLAAKVAGVALSVGKFALDKVADRAIDKKPPSPAALFAPDGTDLPFAGRS